MPLMNGHDTPLPLPLYAATPRAAMPPLRPRIRRRCRHAASDTLLRLAPMSQIRRQLTPLSHYRHEERRC